MRDTNRPNKPTRQAKLVYIRGPHGLQMPRTLESIVIETLKKNGETSTANIGNEYFQPNGMASNPGTLAVSTVLRSLKNRGMVTSRYVSGRGYGRTLWSLSEVVTKS